MPKILIYFWVLLLMLTLLSCGGGGSGSGGANIVVTFGVEEDDTEVGPGSHRKLVADAAYADDGDPASGVGVSFSFRQNESGASLSRVTSETRGDGTAEGVYHAGQRPGNDIVEIKVGGAKATVNLRVAGGGEIVETLTLSADPDEVDIGGYSTIAVEGQTFEGLPAAGTRVEFSFEVNNSGGEFRHEGQSKQTITDYLDSSGRMSLTYRAGSSSGIDVINVKSLDLLQAREQISIIVGQAKTLGEITLEGFKTATEAEWVVRAIVRDRDGNLAPDVVVNFNADHGNLSSSSETTNVNGIAEVFLQDTYWARVEAQVEEVQHEIALSVYEHLEAKSMIIEAPDYVAGSSVNVHAVVYDDNNQPIQDFPVRFEAEGSLQVFPVNESTDEYGTASTNISTTEPGTFRFWAYAENISRSAVITFEFEDPTDPESSVIDIDMTDRTESSSVPIRVTVYDQAGNPIEGIRVSFESDKGWLTYTWRTTDNNGRVENTLYYLDTGEVTVTVRANDKTEEASVIFE